MNKAIWLIVVLIVILLAGFYLVKISSQANLDSETAENNQPSNAEANTDGDNMIADSQTKTFVLTGQNFKFVMDGVDNPEIRVKQGDRVRIEFSSTQGFHDWVVDEFNAATEQVRDTDGPTFVEFVADKKGTFEYYCSVGEHRANGMWGNLIVE